MGDFAESFEQLGRVQDELYETSINFSDIDSPDQKLVLSQFSQHQEELVSQKEKESRVTNYTF